MIITVLGRSGSGKDSLVDAFIKEHPAYTKIVPVTTRPMRCGEIDGVDYEFVTNDMFTDLLDDETIIDCGCFNNWWYGVPRKDFKEQNKIVAISPYGLRRLKENGIKTFSVCLNVNPESRAIKCLERGDKLAEVYRRSIHDEGQFAGVAYEVDGIIDNWYYENSQAEMRECLEQLIHDAGLEI